MAVIADLIRNPWCVRHWIPDQVRDDNPGRRDDNPGRRDDNPGSRDDNTGPHCRNLHPFALRQASATRMVLGMQHFKPLQRDVRVDGGGGDISVPEQHLHRAQIGAVVEQMRGKGMAQGVR